uniref:Uncharacterized protein n=1 Tax=Leersia perrieri TaxID=77586 RepID=A0A0D9XUV9_9ORYZ
MAVLESMTRQPTSVYQQHPFLSPVRGSSFLAGRSSVNILCVHCKLPVLYILAVPPLMGHGFFV